VNDRPQFAAQPLRLHLDEEFLPRLAGERGLDGRTAVDGAVQGRGDLLDRGHQGSLRQAIHGDHDRCADAIIGHDAQMVIAWFDVALEGHVKRGLVLRRTRFQLLLGGEREQQARGSSQFVSIDNQGRCAADLNAPHIQVAKTGLSGIAFHHKDTKDTEGSQQRRQRQAASSGKRRGSRDQGPHLFFVFFLCALCVFVVNCRQENSCRIGSASTNRIGRLPGPGIIVVSRLMPMP
jgi:hypothetical protein